MKIPAALLCVALAGPAVADSPAAAADSPAGASPEPAARAGAGSKRDQETAMIGVLDLSPTVWTAEERRALLAGEPVARSWRDEDGRSRGLTAALVKAPEAVIWKQIVDIDAYVEFMPYVTASYLTRWEEAADHTHIVAGYHLTTLGVTTRYNLDERWYADRGLMLFRVTPVGAGPVNGGDGWWRVSPFAADGRMLLEYSVDLSTQWWVPSALERRAASRLPTLIRLMRKRAEAAAEG